MLVLIRCLLGRQRQNRRRREIAHSGVSYLSCLAHCCSSPARVSRYTGWQCTWQARTCTYVRSRRGPRAAVALAPGAVRCPLPLRFRCYANASLDFGCIRKCETVMATCEKPSTATAGILILHIYISIAREHMTAILIKFFAHP